MQKPEPIIVPPMAPITPMARIPQIPPQVVAIRRRVYVPPAIRQANQARQAAPLQFSPLAQPHRPNRSFYIPPEMRYVQTTEQSSWLSRPLPETPRPFPLTRDTGQFASIQKTPTNVFQPSITRGMPVASAASTTLPHSQVGYTPTSTRRSDPGVGETLLGCATLLVIGIIVLVALYYLAM